MYRGKMQKFYRSQIVRHAFIILIICVVTWLFLSIMGNFVILHPNAYRDLLRSILIPYGIGVLLYNIYAVGFKKKSLKGSSKKVLLWWGNITAFESICLIFTLITSVNSIMMLTGIDAPKQGVFTYVHMMTRLGIITFIVMLFMWQDIVKRTRQSSFNFSISNVLQEAPKKIVTSVSIVFTVLTTVYCLVMIAFQDILNPVGGAFFYQLLLAMLLITSLFLLLLRLMKR